MSGLYNEGAERYEASLLTDEEWDRDYDEAQAVFEAEADDLQNGPAGVSPYRCTDRMCGALDCSNCYPGGCEPEPEEEL